MKLGLAFSGGKDSWACLWLLRERLAEAAVIWVDTGKNYPELLASVDLARKLCPNFVRVEVDRDAQNRRDGLPADVVPIQWTRIGQQFSGPKSVTIQPYLSCCFENISQPLHEAALAHGITHLVRGQRNDEGHKGTARNGTVVDGITMLHPIEDWNEQDVLGFVAKHMDLPEHFQLKHSSMDCYDCTAYRRDSVDRVAFMRARHPSLYAEYEARQKLVESAVQEALFHDIEEVM